MGLMIVIDIAMIIVAISIALCFYRVVVGPTIPDRVVGLDTIAVNIMAVIALYSIKMNTKLYLDAALVIAILGFMSTVAIAKFLRKGDVIDRDYN